MAEIIDESMIRNFVHRVFRKTDNIGTLTVKSIRSEFLKHLGIERLEAEEKELFKKSVHDIYALYASKCQKQNGDQGPDDDASQTATQSDNDSTTSSASSPQKKKRRINSDSDSDKDDSQGEDMGMNGSTMAKKQLIKGKNGTRRPKSEEFKKNVDSGNDQNDNNEQDNKISSNKRTPQQTEMDDNSSEDEQQKKKKSPKNNNAQEIRQKKRSIEYNSEDEQEPVEFIGQKIVEEEKSADSSSSESINSEEKQVVDNKKHKDNSPHEGVDDTQKKHRRKKSRETSPSSAARKKKSSQPSEDSAKLRNLKRYVRSCGMHLKYVEIFADCKSMSQKERMLDRLIRDRTGFEGRITLKMCQKYKKEKEEADEVAELDCRNIITTGGGRRATRSSCAEYDNQPPPPTVRNSDAPSSVFSRLKGIVDSDGSESGDEKTPGKQTRDTFTEKEDSHENRKKRWRLDSSSEDDDDDDD